MADDPSRRCTCGFRRFHERRIRSETEVQRWMLFDDMFGGGFGSTGFGTYFGAGSSGTYGEFTGTLKTAINELSCENCFRIRSTTPLSSGAFFASYVAGSYYYVVGSDLTRPITCYSLRFEGPGGVFEEQLKFHAAPPPPVFAPAPPNTAVSPPAGAIVVDTLLRVRLPEFPQSGTYLVTLIDRCGGFETPMAEVFLEEAPMIVTPDQAELNGFPELWLRQNLNLPPQFASGSTKGVPLEYCEEVLEYDARFGSLPDAQGWSHEAGAGVGSPGNYSLVEGGALRGSTPGATNPSYWEKAATLGAVPGEVHAYSSYLWEADTPTPAVGEGLDFQGLFAGSAAPFAGVRWSYRDGVLYVTELGAGGEAAWTQGKYDRNGWHYTAGSLDGGENQMIHNRLFDDGHTFGTTGAAASDEIRARFGDVLGEGITAYVRNFVVSSPGRFCRPWFRTVAPVVDPKLRLFLIRDLAGTPDLTARIKVRYGPGTASPYAFPTTVVSATVNMVAANAVLEVPFDLTGLTQNAPFFFTVERDWGHTDDKLVATAWLLQATVRSS